MPTETLTDAASSILKNVLAAMQEADELSGGVESNEDYANLMQAIADEALKRKRAALEVASIDAEDTTA